MTIDIRNGRIKEEKKGAASRRIAHYKILAKNSRHVLLGHGRLFLRFRFRIASVSIFADGISNTECGQHEADDANQSFKCQHSSALLSIISALRRIM